VSNSQARVEEVFAEAARLFASKNLHYGDSWRDQGWRGNVSRVLEKAKRVRNMVWRGGNILLNGTKEHPRETMLDMINTLAFAIINMDDGVEWGDEPQASTVQAPGLAYVGQVNSLELGPLNPEQARRLAEMHYGDPLPQEEQTATNLPVVGEVPVPGEERSKPTPRKRGQGSGPRPVIEHPKP